MSKCVEVSLERALWLRVASALIQVAADLDGEVSEAEVDELLDACGVVMRSVAAAAGTAVSEPSAVSPDQAAGQLAGMERQLIVQAEGLLRRVARGEARQTYREVREWLEAVDVCRLRWARQGGVQV